MSVATRMEARQRLAEAAKEAGMDAERLLAVFERSAPQLPEEPPPSPPPLGSSDPAIFAAICDTFTYEEVAAAGQGGATSAKEIDALLAHAAPVILGGQRRLRLFPEARRQILEKSRNSIRFRALLQNARSRPLSENAGVAQRQNYWVHEFLGGSPVPLETLNQEDLARATAALEALEGVPLGDQTPGAPEARRLLDFARLIEPLKILVGARDGAPGEPLKDRFVGREADLTRLRSHVDELASQTLSESFQRSVQRIGHKAVSLLGGRSPGPLVIEARGGLGKSTLIAKFVLDHATGGSQRFGFAYLDFDRAGLQPQPEHLLSEVVRQASLQFPAFRQALDEMRESQRGADGPEALSPEAQFRSVRDMLRREGGGRSFLLVLDTMEVVQYNPVWVDAVVEFVKTLHGGEFPELRVVAAGRADIPELREENEYWSQGSLHSLDPLGVYEAREMVSRLGRDLIPHGWNQAWEWKIAGRSTQPANRREPLSLRVAVELLRSIEDVGEREKFADEIAEAGDAHDSFVGKLYQRRILDHVRDPEVKKLAWPGLVLRTITPELIRTVLAGPCELDPTRIAEVFEALGREVWIVRREGDSLRHRPDLRARTLPLMRRKDPEKFSLINRAAIARFAGDPTREGRAEWIYHRLLDGEDPQSIDRDWDEELATLLAGSVDDFRTDVPAAAAYLQARTSRRLVAAAQLAQLPESLAFEHVARTARRLAQLDDQRSSPIVLDLALRAGRVSEGSLPPEAEEARQAILIKTGQWRSESLERGPGKDRRSPPYDVSWSVYTARAALPGDERLGPSVEAQDRLVARFLRSPDPRQLRARVQDLARLRRDGNSMWRELDLAIAQTIDHSSGTRLIADPATWRLCAITGEASSRGALRKLAQVRRRESGGVPSVVAEAELLALAACGSWFLFVEFLGSRLQYLDFNLDLLRLRASAALEAEQRERSWRARVEDPELADAVHRLVMALADSEDERDLRALRAYSAVRSEDWIVPLGYTLLRRHGREEPPLPALQLLGSGSRGSLFARVSGRIRPLALNDPVVSLRRADEGGQMAAVLRFYGEHPGDPAGEADLHYLHDLYLRWRIFLVECAAAEA